MAQDIDLGKISITPKGTWTMDIQVEYNDVWAYSNAKFLALQNSKGVTPADDRVYWFMLSSAGKSAYETAVENGFIGTEEEWIQSIKQPAIDAAAMSTAAVASMDARYLEEIEEIKTELESTVDDAVADRVARPLIISEKESKAGAYKIGGEDIDIYERTVRLLDLPQTVDETVDYVIADEPLGYGLFFKVESFMASTGRSLTGSFFNSYYEIAGYSINESLQSIVTIRCKQSVPQPVNGLLHIQYCKFYGDVVEFDVTLPSGVNKESVTLEIPPLKFNKKIAFSYVTDDSYSIFQYIFSAINKRFIAKKFELPNGNSLFYHLNMQGNPEFDQYVSEGYYPEHFLQCTDSAGIKRRYATSVAAWADKFENGFGQDVGMYNPYISEREFNYFRDFGFCLTYHDLIGYIHGETVTQDQFDECVRVTASTFQQFAGITPKIIGIPSGYTEMVYFSQKNDMIQAIMGGGSEYSQYIYPYRDDVSIDKHSVAIYRDFNTATNNEIYKAELLSKLAALNSLTDLNEIYWLIGGAHRSSHWETEFLIKINELYGDIGLDNLWFPTTDEFYEYWFMRMNTVHVKTITDTGIHFKMYVPKMPNFFYRDLSVLLSGISDITDVQVTSGSNVYGTSFAVNSEKLLINLNFDKNLMERVEKHVSLFEANYNAEYMYDNAYYFVQQLKPGLKEIYLSRLNVWTSPPTLASFSINSGDATTKNPVVTLNISYSGQAPTHYIASENSDFSGAEWKDYTAMPSFTLSGAFEQKTVYVKLRNIYGQSGSLSDSIELLEPDLALSGISINSGATSTTDEVVNISFSYTGFPDYLMVSENPDFTGAAWQAFSSPVQFTLSSGYGTKILYAKLKKGEDDSNITSVSTSAIDLVDPVSAILNGISINSGAEYTSSGTVSVVFDIMNTITKYKIGLQPDLSDCPDWIPWSGSTVSFASGVTSGILTVYARVANDNNESAIRSDSIQVVIPVSLSSITIASGAETFQGYAAPVAFSIAQGIPTHYRLSETAAELSLSEWLPWSDNILYTFDSIGSKTLYGQVRNEVSTSGVVNDSITILEPPASVILWNANNDFGAPNFEYFIINGITTNKVLFTNSSTLQQVDLMLTTGVSSGIYLLKNTSHYPIDEDSTSNGMGLNYSSTRQPSLSGNTGDYPDELMLNYRYVNDPPYSPGRLKWRMPEGNYKMRLVMSTSSSTSLAGYLDYCFYRLKVGDSYLDPVPAGVGDFTGVNNNEVNAEIEFTVTNPDTVVTLLVYNNYDGTPRLLYRPGLNLVEIIKL